MIHTFTPNPSIDRAFGLEALAVGQVNRTDSVSVDAGGKGINISRALAAHGVQAPAVFPYGGSDGRLLVETLADLGVASVPVWVDAETRTNVTVSHNGGHTTKINAPGQAMSTAHVTALVEALTNAVDSGDIVVAAGSLAPGMPESLYAEVADQVFQRGGRLAVDASGVGLSAVLEAENLEALWLIKPNLEELEEFSGVRCLKVQDVVSVIQPLVERGLGCALVSLGEWGLLYVDAQTVAWAGGAPLEVVSSVGAGDLTLAGFLFGFLQAGQTLTDPLQGSALRNALAQAAVWGRAAVQLPGTRIPSREDFSTVTARVHLEVSPHTIISELPSDLAESKP